MPAEHPATQLHILRTENDARSAWADVVIDGEHCCVTAHLAGQLLALYPSLAQHACKSGPSHAHEQPNAPSTFGARLIGALLPHAAEHLAIEYLVRDHPGETFAGNTVWLSREEQTMRVRVSQPATGGAEQSLGAITEAIEQLNQLLAS